MPFLGLFRSKKEKLNAGVAELHSKVVLATLKSTIAIETTLKEKLETALKSSAGYDLRCEIYCFYAHILDYFSFGVLGVRGRDIVMDDLVPLGIVPFVHISVLEAGDEVWEPLIADLLERSNTMTFEYSESHDVFTRNMAQVVQRGGVPGTVDAFSDEPEAKVSRLIQNVNLTLQGHLPRFGTKSELVFGGAAGFGTSPESMSFVLLCAAVQNTIYQELAEANLLDRLSKIRPLV